MIVVDTSFVYALLDRQDARHRAAADWYERVDEMAATTPLAIAEIDHLAGRAGRAARAAFRSDLAGGAYAVDWWAGAAAQIVQIAERHRDLDVSLADASLVALCDRLATTALATFDEPHFRALRPLAGARSGSSRLTRRRRMGT